MFLSGTDNHWKSIPYSIHSPWYSISALKSAVISSAGWDKKALKNADEVCYDVKGIAELLGWEYKSVKIPKSTKVLIVRFDKFLTFLYPNLSEKEANK